MADRSEIRAAYRVMAAAYPQWARQQDTETAAAWESLLRDVPIGRLVGAVTVLAQSSQWPPTVAEIREAAGCDLPGSAQRKAAAAAAAAQHEAWVAEQERIATERARASLEAKGVKVGSLQVEDMLRRVGR